MWLTPKATSIGENETPEAWQERAARLKERHGTGPNTGLSLPLQAQMWPTPWASATNGPSANEISEGDPRGRLETAASVWRTPHTRDHHPTSRGERSCGQPAQVYLAHQAEHWATPTQRDHKGGAPSRVGTTRLDTMAELEFPPSRPGPDAERSGLKSSQIARTSRPRLNPTFVEWLMGLPEGWTGFGLSVMESCLWRQRMRCLLSALVSKESDEPQLSLFGND
jgi:hypothetical protein